MVGVGDLLDEVERLPLGLGAGGHVILGLLPYFLSFRIGRNNPSSPVRGVADDESRMGQGHSALCPCVGEKAGAADLVSLGKVNDFVPFGAHVRVDWTVTFRRRYFLRTVVF